jgi:CheY-like chemotaxis protein
VRALEQAARMKNDFLSRMSHELRTPLNAVLGFSQLQLMDTQSSMPPASRERAEHIQRAGEHLLSLIEEAMDIASIESGHLVITIEPVDVAAVVGECLSMAEPQARQGGVTLNGSAAASASGRVLADPRRLRQVLLNLVSNAIKYNRPGGEVRVAWHPEGGSDRMTIAVTDTGQGMSSQQLQRLFQPFDRLGAERTAVQGSGLGLVITRLLVQAMGGTLQIDSRAGRGTVAQVSLPAAVATAAASPAAVAPGPKPAAATRPSRVLYIEDNAASRALMAGVVAGLEGFSLALASDGLSGLAQARQVQPDVVIVALNLPDIDGISVLRALRQQPATCGCRCVAVSADLGGAVEKRVLAAGFDEFWPKPSGLEFMRERLARLLSPQPQG